MPLEEQSPEKTRFNAAVERINQAHRAYFESLPPMVFGTGEERPVHLSDFFIQRFDARGMSLHFKSELPSDIAAECSAAFRDEAAPAL